MLKSFVKKASISLGLYRPVSYLNDLRWGRLYSKRISADTEFYRSLLPPNSLVFDIGANVGNKTEALVKAGHRVIAVEPQPDCANEIAARCNVEIVRAAVGVEEGTLELHLSDVYHTMASASKTWTDSSTSIKVPMVTLDSLIENYGTPYYIKIDVEGYEYEVLMGLSHSIPLISFEFHSTELEKARKCLSLLSGRIAFTPPESNEISEWMDFDSDFPDYVYGDVWVKSAPSH